MRQLLCGQKLLLYLLSPLCRVFTIIHVYETNHVSWVNSDAAVLYLQFVLHVMLLRSEICCLLVLFVIIIPFLCIKVQIQQPECQLRNHH